MCDCCWHVEKLNPIPVGEEATYYRRLTSHDEFTDVDDPNGHLRRTLDHAILNDFNSNDVPPHFLHLKENDVCLIMRPMKVSVKVLFSFV